MRDNTGDVYGITYRVGRQMPGEVGVKGVAEARLVRALIHILHLAHC
jgi:hypothetical protein